ncbi:MAG TPA: DUF4296 domain-containing protein [Flavobacteriaceae bacterium]|nr:DUF4296 domain-containing protein [Flavobacteriaceae bacterium]
MSCQDIEETPKPDNLIPEDKMVEILVDLAKVDAAFSISSKEYKKRGVVGREMILEKYDIDSVQLVKSNAYYAEDFKVNQRIYEAVQTRLQRENDSLRELNDKLKAEEKEARGKE